MKKIGSIDYVLQCNISRLKLYQYLLRFTTFYFSTSKTVQKTFKKHSIINISLSSNAKLKNILGNPKNRIENKQKSGIYKITSEIW